MGRHGLCAGFLACLAGVGALSPGFYRTGQATELKTVDVSDCTFVAKPDQFLGVEQRIMKEAASRARKLNPLLASRSTHTVAASSLPVRNFVDSLIFDRLTRQNVPAAALSSDQEFARRLYLDLTGRLPSVNDLRSFLDDGSPDKRNRLIDTLLQSEEFTDRWTVWIGDWLRNTSASSNINRQLSGRNAYHRYLCGAVETDKSLRDVTYEVLSARGNNFELAGAPANFTLLSNSSGPIQDTYDTALITATSLFLGLAHFDCLLCHNGRGHVEDVSLWGAGVTRTQAQQMAAFFSRQRFTIRPSAKPLCEADSLQSCTGMPYFFSFDINDVTTGAYALSTNFGNRPNRIPIGTTRELTPVYYATGAEPKGPYWREDFAESVIRDPMFARNVANRLWREIFNLGLVEPVDAMDPARLDPRNPPAAPWTLQASHPELLEQLSDYLAQVNFQLRPFLRLLLQSSAYQLSSRYDGEWTPNHVPLFARRLARRLDAEEVHDAIAKATGVLGSYNVNGFGEPVRWAMQLPEPLEPRGNPGNALSFMNTFFRGNRDNQQRRQDGSVQQQLSLMNDQFVLNRVRVNTSPFLKEIAAIPSNETVVENLFLTFLSRYPLAQEKTLALVSLAAAANTTQRNAAIEDLAWTCVNKVEFLFSY